MDLLVVNETDVAGQLVGPAGGALEVAGVARLDGEDAVLVRAAGGSGKRTCNFAQWFLNFHV